MGVFGKKLPIRRKPWCRECKTKRADVGDICRHCRKAGYTDNAETQARRAREAAERERQRTREIVQRVEVPRQTRTIIVDGAEFEVVWDGRV
jgi:hypothetical protein